MIDSNDNLRLKWKFWNSPEFSLAKDKRIRNYFQNAFSHLGGGIFSQYLQIAINLALHCVKIDLLNVIWTILNELEFFIQQKWMKMNSKKSTVLWAVSNEFQKCWKKIFGQKWSFSIMVRTHMDFIVPFKHNSRVWTGDILLNGSHQKVLKGDDLINADSDVVFIFIFVIGGDTSEYHI